MSSSRKRSVDSITNDEECVLCYENDDTGAFFTIKCCQVGVHRHCFEKIRKPECPFCRAKLDDDEELLDRMKRRRIADQLEIEEAALQDFLAADGGQMVVIQGQGHPQFSLAVGSFLYEFMTGTFLRTVPLPMIMSFQSPEDFCNRFRPWIRMVLDQVVVQRVPAALLTTIDDDEINRYLRALYIFLYTGFERGSSQYTHAFTEDEQFVIDCIGHVLPCMDIHHLLQSIFRYVAQHHANDGNSWARLDRVPFERLPQCIAAAVFCNIGVSILVSALKTDDRVLNQYYSNPRRPL